MASYLLLGTKTKMKVNQNKEGKEKEIKNPVRAYTLFLQMLAKIHTEWALAQVTVSERQSKRTPRKVFLKTAEIVFNPEVLCTAEKLKATFCTFEVLWALHFPYDFFNLLPVFVFHGFFLFAQQCLY